MIKFDVQIDSLKKLDEYIEYVNRMKKMKVDKSFQKFIQDKVLELAKKVTDERLVGGTSNDEEIELYKSSHHILEETDGFILYNDAKIEANAKDNTNYPNGEFSIALAFEYGVGITGEGTYQEDYFSSWDYNVNDYNFGWYYLKDGVVNHSFGYEGFEIYRNIAIEIERNLKKWVNEYYSKKYGGVSK